MYLIAIGYAYVIFLVALASGSLLAGLSIALFLGVLPLWAFIRLTIRRARRRSVAMPTHPGLGQAARHPDGEDAQPDQ
jgi:Flp pilus assembly protein TadB